MLIADIQFAQIDTGYLPTVEQLQQWAVRAYESQSLLNHVGDRLVSICIVDKKESQALNKQYRQQDKPTNVLSFPMQMPADIEPQILGDIVICADIVLSESQEQNKMPEHHWAHMVIHGVLHLCDYDHQDSEEAQLMETLETEIMAELGLPDPYG